MNARETILSAIRAAAVPPAPPAAPVVREPPAAPRHEAFLEVLRAVGGNGLVRGADRSMDDAMHELFGDTTDDVTVLRGRFAVAENAAVYVDDADIARRDAVVRGERIALIVPFAALVPTMHEAVRRMPVGSACGWFLSGPSKTADIEQSLVIGAQGARSLAVIFDAG